MNDYHVRNMRGEMLKIKNQFPFSFGFYIYFYNKLSYARILIGSHL